MLLGGVLFAAAGGDAASAQAALLAGGGEAVEFALSMAGTYAFFGGLLQVMRESGLTEAFAARLRRPLARLLRFAPGEEAALGDICVNLAADMLGMGGAATPAGLSAMRKMALAGGGGGRMSSAMTMFLVINMCSVQLLPATMIGLRAAAGAESPADIILPTLGATGAAMAAGLLLCGMIVKGKKTDA